MTVRLGDIARRLIRRNARKILKEANGNADAFERITADLFAAPVTKGERKAAARARKEAVAKITPVTGAYGQSMASNYNKVPRPAVVFVTDGVAREVVRRETFDDLLRLDRA